MSESKEFTINNRFEGEVLHKGLAKDFKSFCEEKKVNLSGSNLRGSDLSGSDLSGSNLRGSNLRGSNLRGSNLRGSDLSGSNLRGSNLRGSDLSGSDLSDSDLSGSDLSDSDLSDSDLSGSNLRGSDLSGSNLSGSDLSGSNLRGSNLRGSDLSGSDLSGSDLSGSDLSIYCKWSVSFIPKTSVNPDSEKVLINEIDINTVLIKIGCKEPKTIADWDLWFEGTQVFDTPRSSFEFYQIKGMYLAYKAYLQTITSFKKEGEKVV